MENFDQPIDMGMAPSMDDSLRITPEVRQYWKETSAWALFFAILLFIVFGLVSLAGIFLLFAGGVSGFISGIFVIAIYGVLLFFPAYFYFLFSSQMKQALITENRVLLVLAFVNLKRFYRFVGILLIVLVALGIFAFLIFGVALLNNGPSGY